MIYFKSAIPYFYLYLILIPGTILLKYFSNWEYAFYIIQFIIIPLIGINTMYMFNSIKVLKQMAINSKARNLYPIFNIIIAKSTVVLILVTFLGQSSEITKLLITQIVFFVTISTTLGIFVSSLELSLTIYLSYLFSEITSKGTLIPFLHPFLYDINLYNYSYKHDIYTLFLLSLILSYLIYIKLFMK